MRFPATMFSCEDLAGLILPLVSCFARPLSGRDAEKFCDGLPLLACLSRGGGDAGRLRLWRGSTPFGNRIGSNPFGDRAAIEPSLLHDVTDISAFIPEGANMVESRLP
ncbi:MAG: hypothetical protein ACR65Z_07265 [Methylocystis sp.]